MVQYLHNVSMCLWWCRWPLTPEAQAAQISVVTLQKTEWFSFQLIQMSPYWRYFSTYCSFSISGDNTHQETVYSPCWSKWAFSDLSAPKKNVQSTKSSRVNKTSSFENHETYIGYLWFICTYIVEEEHLCSQGNPFICVKNPAPAAPFKHQSHANYNNPSLILPQPPLMTQTCQRAELL